MKQLNTKSTQIFLKLLKKLNNDDHVKMEVKGFMPLQLEFLHKIINGEAEGKLYSLSHTYVQNGDLMRDPEMCFIVEPNQRRIRPSFTRNHTGRILWVCTRNVFTSQTEK